MSKTNLHHTFLQLLCQSAIKSKYTEGVTKFEIKLFQSNCSLTISKYVLNWFRIKLSKLFSRSNNEFRCYENYTKKFFKSFSGVKGAFLSPFYLHLQFHEIFLKLWTIFSLNLEVILQDRRCTKIWKCPQPISDLILSHIQWDCHIFLIKNGRKPLKPLETPYH